jgi:glycosyltransferase involved in cell wall biosynthesis
LQLSLPTGEFDNVYPFAAKALDRGIGNIYRQCQRRLCISPEMAALLEQKYGVTGEVLYPNRSEVIIPRPLEQSRSWKNPEVFTLGYAGSLSSGYGETVKKLCAVLSDGNIRLNYYGREDKALLGSFSRDTVVQQGFSSPPEMLWRKVQAECDAVILPYSFNEGYRPLYSSHFPSKLPEYLALNMPVIVLGPTYATGVRWALQNPDAAIAITQPQPDRWLEILRKLAASEQNRVSLAIGATDAGKRHFCPEKIKKIFTAAIIEAAENRMLTPVC